MVLTSPEILGSVLAWELHHEQVGWRKGGYLCLLGHNYMGSLCTKQKVGVGPQQFAGDMPRWQRLLELSPSPFIFSIQADQWFYLLWET